MGLAKLRLAAVLICSALPLAACVEGINAADADILPAEYEAAEVDADENSHSETLNAEVLNVDRINFVDERVELVSLVFRLAGRREHNDRLTEYQRGLDEAFAKFRDHQLVVYTRENLAFGYCCILHMAIHLEETEQGFITRDNIDFLLEDVGGVYTWTGEKAAEFVGLLNDFYNETNFAEFFRGSMPYYLEISADFYEQLLGEVNLEWFRQFGVNPAYMRAVVSPSSGGFAYAGMAFGEGDDIIYAAIPVTDNFWRFHRLIIHEFSHAVGNPIGEAWYAENEEFRQWSDSTVDLRRMPFYPNGLIIAREYVTRAFTVLYMAENSERSIAHYLREEFLRGFHYIEYVYAMIAEHEWIGIDDTEAFVAALMNR
ncbi:MAG: DUF4932 domain-containing protein [Defluviitaleaceae bacterium]|nr:DUF4932 domain-containing protein [Defluviitaleaceae bacterium]